MKKLLLLACLFVLTGCAKQPVIANLNPRLGDQPAGIYSSPMTAAVMGQDLRKTAEVVAFMNDQPVTRLANVSAPVELISARLARGFKDQGLTVDAGSPVHLKFSLNDLVVRVTHQKMLYTAEAKTHIILNVENQGTVLTRVFKREGYSDSATRPDLPDLEGMLNTQLTDIVQQILQDDEIRQLIHRK